MELALRSNATERYAEPASNPGTITPQAARSLDPGGCGKRGQNWPCVETAMESRSSAKHHRNC
eukprot:6050120-Amphidinium_carterae.4